MTVLPRVGHFALLSLAIALCTTGCHRTAAQTDADTNQAGTQDQASDPASANLVPVAAVTPIPAATANTTGPAAKSAPGTGASNGADSVQPAPQGALATVPCVTPGQAAAQAVDDPGNGTEPLETASQPPPPLPEYEQPEAPNDNSLWTPGYWGYAPTGYYWVPGLWVEAPYMGALWTPGYWGFWHHRYGFYGGYWGPHIGYYGGINYGFGYVGFGYQGGYWGGGHFHYNTSVNRVNVSLVHNVYSRSVVGNTNASRVSFNGGRGGIQTHARPAEFAARQEAHSAPSRTQTENVHAASTNRAQFVNVNHGQPANAAVRGSGAAVHGAAQPAAREEPHQAQSQQRGAAQTHSRAEPAARGNQAGRSESARPAASRNEPARSEPRQAPQRQAAPRRQAAPQRQEAPKPGERPKP